MRLTNGLNPFFNEENDLGLEGTALVWLAFVLLTATLILTGV